MQSHKLVTETFYVIEHYHANRTHLKLIRSCWTHKMTRKECEAQYNHEQFLKALKRNSVGCYQCNVVRGWPVELVDCREPKNLTLGTWSFPGVCCGRIVRRVAVRVDTTLWCGTYLWQCARSFPGEKETKVRALPHFFSGCPNPDAHPLGLCAHNEQQLKLSIKVAYMRMLSSI